MLFFINKFLCGAKFFDIKRRMLIASKFEIGEGTCVVGPLDLAPSCDLSIGKNCWIGKNLTVNGNGKVSIGDCCDLGPEVSFQTGGHEIGNSERRAGQGITYDISVGNGCWIGARSTILGGTSIGDSCIVASCACVVKNVEKNLLVGGVPARTIKELGDG